MRPLCIDLFCGLGGWTEGFLSEGFDVIGFDIEQHVYGEHRYPAELVLQDVRTLHGRQFKDADIIVASSPCQEFSYRAMPWKRAKALGPPVLGMELFAQAGRIQREACEASGRHIPMIQENVRGAQPWVGKAAWRYGSFFLWGDIPALMPVALRDIKNSGGSWFAIDGSGNPGQRNDPRYPHLSPIKNKTGGSWFAIPGPGGIHANNNPTRNQNDGVKGFTPHGQPLGKNELGRKHGSKSKARKEASAKIAKIPFPLAEWIARVTREARMVA